MSDHRTNRPRVVTWCRHIAHLVIEAIVSTFNANPWTGDLLELVPRSRYADATGRPRLPPRHFHQGGLRTRFRKAPTNVVKEYARANGQGSVTKEHSGLGSGLVMREVPPVSLLTRDPDRALQFELPSTKAEYIEPWYHTITFPDGEVTPGFYDHRELLPHYGLPEDLSEKRVLDVGTANGFWAFEMERRGAEVTAVDVSSSLELDFPPQVLARLRTMPPRPRGQRFREAHARLGSQVRYLDLSAYSLNEQALGQFDLVHAGDILLHLERPLETLRRFRDVTRIDGQLIVSDVVDPNLPPRQGPEFTTKYLGGWEGVTWWCPSIDALGQMIIDAGFNSVELHLVYMLPTRGSDAGPWRAVFRASP